ncbi:hypothetical protein C8Q73DRAFT_795210 [Cubamyces lactineus]|nr:hypothetical protein C8Q73DRAFT_795210 [Cubamyces lactineus]
MLTVAATLTTGASVNRTIDDQKGDSVTGAVPLYLPSGAWNIGQTCTSCAFRANDPIDVSQVIDGTWHDATHYGASDPDPKTIQVNFTGHAVYVYHVVINYLTYGIITSTDLAFYIDDELVGSYTHDPTGTKSNNTLPVFYNVPVYTNASLVDGNHTLTIGASGNMEALMLFDYVVYTTEDDSESGPSSSLGQQPHPTLPSQTPSSPASLPVSSALSTSTRTDTSQSSGPTDISTLSSQAAAPSPAVDQPNSQSQSPSSSKGSQVPLPSQAAWSGGHIAEIAGGTAGGIALVAAMVFCILRRRHTLRKKRLQSEPLILDKELADMLEMSSRLDLLEGHDDETAAAQAERFNYLVQRIRTLLAEVDGHRAARSNARKADQLAPTPVLSATEENLSSTLTALRAEMSALRTELGEKCMVLSSDTLPPSYQA